MVAIDLKLAQRHGKRECGFRKVHALYLESLSTPGGTLPQITTLDPALEIDLDQSRGYVYVDGNHLLGLKPASDCLRGSSLERLWKKEGLQRLGLTLQLRRRLGIAKGLTLGQLADRLGRLESPGQLAQDTDWWGKSATVLYEAVKVSEKGVLSIDDAAMLRSGECTGREALAACWRLAVSRKAGTIDRSISEEVVRMMVGLGAGEDARVVGSWLQP